MDPQTANDLSKWLSDIRAWNPQELTPEVMADTERILKNLGLETAWNSFFSPASRTSIDELRTLFRESLILFIEEQLNPQTSILNPNTINPETLKNLTADLDAHRNVVREQKEAYIFWYQKQFERYQKMHADIEKEVLAELEASPAFATLPNSQKVAIAPFIVRGAQELSKSLPGNTFGEKEAQKIFDRLKQIENYVPAVSTIPENVYPSLIKEMLSFSKDPARSMDLTRLPYTENVGSSASHSAFFSTALEAHLPHMIAAISQDELKKKGFLKFFESGNEAGKTALILNLSETLTLWSKEGEGILYPQLARVFQKHGFPLGPETVRSLFGGQTKHLVPMALYSSPGVSPKIPTFLRREMRRAPSATAVTAESPQGFGLFDRLINGVMGIPSSLGQASGSFLPFSFDVQNNQSLQRMLLLSAVLGFFLFFFFGDITSNITTMLASLSPGTGGNEAFSGGGTFPPGGGPGAIGGCDPTKKDCRWPAAGCISQGPPHGTNKLNGIDISACFGCAVWATHDGKVRVAFDDMPNFHFEEASWGNYVIIDGSDRSTIYAHLMQGSVNALGIVAGMKVNAGQQIGNVDTTGYTWGSGGPGTGTHLHYGRYDGGGSVNEILPSPIPDCGEEGEPSCAGICVSP